MSFSRVALLVLLSLVTLSAVSVSAQQQYLANGGFENGPVGFGTGPPWTVVNPFNLAIAVTQSSAANTAAFGNFALEIGTVPSNIPTPPPAYNSSVNVTLTQQVTVPEMSDVFTLCFLLTPPAAAFGQQNAFTVTTSFDGGAVTVFKIDNSVAPVRGTNGAVLSFPAGGDGSQHGTTYSQFCETLTAPPTITTKGQFKVSFATEAQTGYYLLDNITLTGPPTIVGDPQFVGLRGQSFQVHGMDGEVYNLISDKDLQVNSRFVFLTEGTCPMINGKAATNCWSHPGSYLGAIGIQQVIDGKTEQLSFTAGDAKKGFADVTLNGKSMHVGDSYVNGDFSMSYNTSYVLIVDTPTFHFKFDNSDMFVNQQVISKMPLSQLTAHGLFGQTHERKVYSSALKYIAGEADDYAVADNSLFGSDFVYNRFGL